MKYIRKTPAIETTIFGILDSIDRIASTDTAAQALGREEALKALQDRERADEQAA